MVEIHSVDQEAVLNTVICIKHHIGESGDIGGARDLRNAALEAANVKRLHDPAGKFRLDNALLYKRLIQFKRPIANSAATLAEVPVPQGERSMPVAFPSSGGISTTTSLQFASGAVGLS